jgi:hypothetical protein
MSVPYREAHSFAGPDLFERLWLVWRNFARQRAVLKQDNRTPRQVKRTMQAALGFLGENPDILPLCSVFDLTLVVLVLQVPHDAVFCWRLMIRMQLGSCFREAFRILSLQELDQLLPHITTQVPRRARVSSIHERPQLHRVLSRVCNLQNAHFS